MDENGNGSGSTGIDILIPPPKRRCLILVDGFCEWKKEGRHQQPFHVCLGDGRPFAFAGLWEHWEGRQGAAIDSCTILTTTPNDLLPSPA